MKDEQKKGEDRIHRVGGLRPQDTQTRGEDRVHRVPASEDRIHRVGGLREDDLNFEGKRRYPGENFAIVTSNAVVIDFYADKADAVAYTNHLNDSYNAGYRVVDLAPITSK